MQNDSDIKPGDTAQVPSGNVASAKRGKLDQMMPTDDMRIELLSPEGERIHDEDCQLDQGGPCNCKGVWFVFGWLDGKTKAEYDRTIERGVGRPGATKGGYGAAVKELFENKCKAIEGFTADDCEGMEPLRYFPSNPRGRVIMKTAVNEYLRRSLPEVGDSKN